nr:MAG: hypothetical protein AmFV_00242 [Apis mellifera filamentous virus]
MIGIQLVQPFDMIIAVSCNQIDYEYITTDRLSIFKDSIV